MELRDRTFLMLFGSLVYLAERVFGDQDICDIHHHGPYYTYCDDGYHCCDGNKRCCANGLSAGTIIGIIFGIIFIIGVCLVCSIIITKKKKFRPNQMVGPGNHQRNTNVATISRNQQNHHVGYNTNGQVQYAWGHQFYPYNPSIPHGQVSATAPQPPPYSEHDIAPPPAYKYDP